MLACSCYAHICMIYSYRISRCHISSLSNLINKGFHLFNQSVQAFNCSPWLELKSAPTTTYTFAVLLKEEVMHHSGKHVCLKTYCSLFICISIHVLKNLNIQYAVFIPYSMKYGFNDKSSSV